MSASNRPAPPPVVDPNPPRQATRPAPPTETTAPGTPGSSVAHQSGPTAFVTNVGTNVGNTVPGGSVGPTTATALDALLYGRVNPEQDRSQTGVRLPRYVSDAVRVVAATSRGALSMQDIVTEAVKAYLPHDVLVASWQRHGGSTDEQQTDQ
jgi:hypothetical protein